MAIALLTDFGGSNWYSASMKGVIRSLGQDHDFFPEVIDITHDIPSFNIQQAAFTLFACYRSFPKGTVFCVVVDPGVGSERDIIAVRTENYYFIAPDNGVLTYIFDREEIISSVRVREAGFFLSPVSRTFHGRDIFAPCAFHVARKGDVSDLGPGILKDALSRGSFPGILKHLPRESEVKVIAVDNFGNIITNVPSEFQERIIFLNGKKSLPFYHAYCEAEKGEPFAIPGSSGLIEISLQEGNAASFLKKSHGDGLEVEVK